MEADPWVASGTERDGRTDTKDIGGNADPAENDKGALVDLYIPRHCSATSTSRFAFAELGQRWKVDLVGDRRRGQEGPTHGRMVDGGHVGLRCGCWEPKRDSLEELGESREEQKGPSRDLGEHISPTR